MAVQATVGGADNQTAVGGADKQTAVGKADNQTAVGGAGNGGTARPGWPGIIHAYANRIPLPEGAEVITLHEGGTPLVAARRLSELTGCEVYIKVEGANPTGSFKDRGMTVAMTYALASGVRGVICASTGNTSASAAAYAAKAGMAAAVLVPRGKIALGKLAQAVAHGARILQIDGNFDDCLELASKTSIEYPITLVNSVNPVRLIGQKTAAWEICDVLGRAPDVHCLPVGNAGNITAYWRGYSDYFTDGVIAATPRMFGFQAAGSAPLVLGAPVANPETIATAIRVGSPASWTGAVAAKEESGGLFEAVTDEKILEAYRLLASTEGIFVEPASATSVAGLLATAADGRLPKGSVVVCTVTGHGLKDPDTALLGMAEVEPVPVDPGAVATALELA